MKSLNEHKELLNEGITIDSLIQRIPKDDKDVESLIKKSKINHKDLPSYNNYKIARDKLEQSISKSGISDKMATTYLKYSNYIPSLTKLKTELKYPKQEYIDLRLQNIKDILPKLGFNQIQKEPTKGDKYSSGNNFRMIGGGSTGSKIWVNNKSPKLGFGTIQLDSNHSTFYIKNLETGEIIWRPKGDEYGGTWEKQLREIILKLETGKKIKGNQ